jgi:hypothetical protein
LLSQSDAELKSEVRVAVNSKDGNQTVFQIYGADRKLYVGVKYIRDQLILAGSKRLRITQNFIKEIEGLKELVERQHQESNRWSSERSALTEKIRNLQNETDRSRKDNELLREDNDLLRASTAEYAEKIWHLEEVVQKLQVEKELQSKQNGPETSKTNLDGTENKITVSILGNSWVITEVSTRGTTVVISLRQLGNGKSVSVALLKLLSVREISLELLLAESLLRWGIILHKSLNVEGVLQRTGRKYLVLLRDKKREWIPLATLKTWGYPLLQKLQAEFPSERNNFERLFEESFQQRYRQTLDEFSAEFS